jgi:hypothetical protein
MTLNDPVPTKRELQAENAKLKKLLMENEELLREAAIRVEELLGLTSTSAALRELAKKRRLK